jgi:hypothetical protein
MNRAIFFPASIALTTVLIGAVLTANAGAFENGTWSATGCGTMPQTPVIDSSSVDTFNKSIGKINDWQKQIQTYHDCMIREANADNAAINKAATAEQARINEAVEKVNKEAATGKQKIEQSSSSSSPSFPSLAPPPGSGTGGQGY